MTTTVLHPILFQHNQHIRDQYIDFDEPTHVYTINIPPTPENEWHAKKPYTSVTTWVHSNFPHFNAEEVIQGMMKGKNWNEQNKYWGLTPEQIKDQWEQNGKNVSSAGTDMHYEIECFMNNPEFLMNPGYTHKELLTYYLDNQTKNQTPYPPHQTTEWKYFLKYLEDTPTLKPYRTEWTIFNEDLHLAGSIDMIYENEDGTLSIYDWKRVKEIKRVNRFNKYALPFTISHMPDTNFWHYAMQLNTYKVILEEKYGKKITKLCLVQIHPEHEENTYEIVDLPDLSSEVRELFTERRKIFTNDNDIKIEREKIE
jgi:CRISPR/Cas system-associated exonuclease Cas4 (RecB family)